MASIQIFPSESLTPVYIISNNGNLVAMCSTCCEKPKDIEQVDGRSYWQCRGCLRIFNWDTEMSTVSVEISAIHPSRVPVIEKWIRDWTGLEVEVTIKW